MEDGRTEVLSGSTSTSGSQPSTPRAESSMGETLCSPTADGSNAHAAKRREKSQRASSGLKWRTFGRSKGLKGQALEMHRMIQSEIAETAGEKSRVSIDSKYDNGRWWRNVFCIANATIGIIFMIVAAGIGWDGEKYRSNSTTDGLKGIVSIFSFILVLQIIEYHRFKTGCVFHTYVKDNEIPWTAFSKDLPSLLLECVVCGYHIPPFCSDYIADKWMIFMFCRAYILLRFLRDISPITDHKNRIITHGFYHLGGSSLNNWLFHARTFIYRKPDLDSFGFLFLTKLNAVDSGSFIVTATAIVYFIMTFSVYVFERHRQPDVFDFKNSLWYTAVTMTTVGFGDIVAKSHMGRVLAVVSGALGIILSSFCVTIASQILTLSNHQKFANDIVQIQDSDRRRLHSAATVIQCWWKLLRLQRTGVPDTMVEYQCRKRLIDATSRLRRYRRLRKNISLYGDDPVVLTRLRLEGRFDPVLDRILKAERSCLNIEKRLRSVTTTVKDPTPARGGRMQHRTSIAFRVSPLANTTTGALSSTMHNPSESEETQAKIIALLDRLDARIQRLEAYAKAKQDERP